LTQAAVTRSNTQPEQGRGATTALVEGRVRLAERIVAAELGSAGLRSPADSTVTEVLLFHAPVAGDLRAVVAAIRSGDDLERMEVLARHVAQAAVRQRFGPA
jgi:phosphate transport system protein